MQHFAHEEGRVRNSEENGLVYDYFIKDHLGNTRMTLTEEVQLIPTTYLATMELDYRQWETDDSQGLGFGNINTSNTEVNITANVTVDQFDELTRSAPNMVLRTNGSYDHLRIGATKMIKVMSGDVVRVEAWAQNPGTVDNGGNLSTITASILGGALGGVSGGAGTDGAIFDLFTNEFTQITTGWLSQGSPATNQPKAYLNWILFDEDFDLVDSSTGYDQVGNGTAKELLQSPSITVQSSGYFYIYVSNESANTIYFDDVRLEHTRGQILQEDHYYPFGLSIKALSSRSPLSKPNKYNTFQEQERTEDFDLGWYQFKWRNHDPTIGRFFNVDPLAEKFYYNSPYAFSENKVVAHVELEGLESVGMGLMQAAKNDRKRAAQQGRKVNFQDNFPKVDITVKYGTGKTFGAGVKLGPFKAGAYGDGGTSSYGWSLLDGNIDERTEGWGVELGPVFNYNEETTKAWSGDGRHKDGDSDVLLIEESTAGLFKSFFKSVNETPFDEDLSKRQDIEFSTMGGMLGQLHENEANRELVGPVGITQSHDEVGLAFGFDIRIFFRLNIEVKVFTEHEPGELTKRRDQD